MSIMATAPQVVQATSYLYKATYLYAYYYTDINFNTLLVGHHVS